MNDLRGIEVDIFQKKQKNFFYKNMKNNDIQDQI